MCSVAFAVSDAESELYLRDRRLQVMGRGYMPRRGDVHDPSISSVPYLQI